MDRIDAMRTFVTVVNEGAFARAAERLDMSPQLASKYVSQLEQHLGVRLLNRTTRKVNVTADGAAYYERVIKLLADLDDAETSLSAASLQPRGRLRVDVPSPFARMILIPALPAFYARYPEIQLDLGVSDRRVDLLEEGVDCVVRGGEMTDLSLVARRVGDLTMGVYATPGYLEMRGYPAHPQALSLPPHYMVNFRWERANMAFLNTLRRDDESVTVQGRYVISVDDGNAGLAAGLAGLGVLWLPDYMAREHVSRGDLVRLFDDWHIDPMPMYIAFPPNRHVSAKLRVFMNWVEALMAQHAPRVERRRQ